jgi:HD superfamily phosphohydrolase YqeK
MKLPRFDEYLAYLGARLTPGRLEHSLETMQVMERLAPLYHLDRLQALSTGLLHDASKDLSDLDQLRLAEEAGFIYSDSCEQLSIYLHGPTAAYLLQRDLKIGDRSILDAVATHSMIPGLPGFETDLGWCMRFADILAPSRAWKDLHAALGPLVYGGDLPAARSFLLAWFKGFFPPRSIPVHPGLLELH